MSDLIRGYFLGVTLHNAVVNCLNLAPSTLKCCGRPAGCQPEINRVNPGLRTHYSLLSPWSRRLS